MFPALRRQSADQPRIGMVWGAPRLRRAAATLMIALLLFAVPARPAAADSWTGPDKAAHFGFSLSFGAAASAVLPFVDAPAAADWRGLALGSGIALLPGVAKEVWDLGGHGDPSWKDLGWDILGATVGAGLVWAVQRAMAPGAAAQAR